jgi:CheY-specific phosphatase CheX
MEHSPMNSVFEPRTIAGCLEKAAEEVLATMFFAEAEPFDDPVDEGAERLSVALRFQGAATGQLSLTVDREVAGRLAENFYGAESTAAEARNVLSELANMVCGTLLSQLDNSAIFHLSEPHAVAPALPAADSALLLRVEEGLLALHFEIEAAERPAH